VLNVRDKWAIKWIQESPEGEKWAKSNGFEPPVTFIPERACKSDDSRPTLVFVGLEDHQTVLQNPLDLYAVVNATSGFKSFYLEYGVGEGPSEWDRLVDNGGQPSDQPQKLLTWNLDNVRADDHIAPVHGIDEQYPCREAVQAEHPGANTHADAHTHTNAHAHTDAHADADCNADRNANSRTNYYWRIVVVGLAAGHLDINSMRWGSRLGSEADGISLSYDSSSIKKTGLPAFLFVNDNSVNAA